MRSKSVIGLMLAAVAVAAAGAWYVSRPEPGMLQFAAVSAKSPERSFSYGEYAAVLGAHVNDGGMVDYGSLQAGRQPLDVFAAALGQLEPSVFADWSEKEKIAFWVNAYNGLTLEAIINHYPIQSSFFKSLLFPKNSIRQIPGVWDKLEFPVIGQRVTLDQIEHQILRAQFNEPRIHVALVCAARGCPPLRSEPFTGERLDAQLDDQTRRFLADPEKFRIDTTKGHVYLSSIFQWFGEDFVETYGTDDRFAGRDKAERAVLNFISQYLDACERDYLATGKYEIKYLDYDWTLNEESGD